MGLEQRAHAKIPGQTQPPIGERLYVVPVHVDTISAFLRGRRHADRREGENWPTPLLGQMVATQTERKNFGHVFVAIMLVPATDLRDKAEELGKDREIIQKGREVFARLDRYREGTEGNLTSKARQQIEDETVGINTPAVRLGRSILEILTAEDYAARLTAADALLAIRLNAVATSRQAAA